MKAILAAIAVLSLLVAPLAAVAQPGGGPGGVEPPPKDSRGK
jgi:hypothetical protein